MLPAASYTPACIGDVCRDGAIVQCGDPAAWWAATSTSTERKDGPACQMHAERLVAGAVDRHGVCVTLEGLEAIGEHGRGIVTGWVVTA